MMCIWMRLFTRKISNISKITAAVFLLSILYYSEQVYALPPICTVTNNVLTIDGLNVEVVKAPSASESQSSTSTSISSSASSSSSNFPELDRAQADKISYQLAIIKLKPILRVKICNWEISSKKFLREILKELLDGIDMAAELDEIEISGIDGSNASLLDMENSISGLLRSMGLIRTTRENTDDNRNIHYKRGIYLRNHTLVIDGENFADILRLIEIPIIDDEDFHNITRPAVIAIGGIGVFLDNFVQRISGLELRNLRLEEDSAIRFLNTISTRLGANLTSINIYNVEIVDGAAPVIAASIAAISGQLTTVRYFGNDAVRESDHLAIIQALGQRTASLYALDVSQNIVSEEMVKLFRTIMGSNRQLSQVYLLRNAVTESGEIELLRFCMEPASAVLNFVDADIGEFASVNTPRMDATLRVIQERNFAIQRLVSNLETDLPNFYARFFNSSRAELVGAVLHEGGNISTASSENALLGSENHDLIAAIRRSQAELRSILNQLTVPSSSLSTSSSTSSQNDQLPSVSIDDNNILLIDGHNSSMLDGIQTSQIIYLLNSIGPQPILGVRIQNLRLIDGAFLLEILHALLDNSSVAAELSVVDIDSILSPLNNHGSRTAIYELLQSRGFALGSDGELLQNGSLIIHSQRYFYLYNNALIIDGANMSNPILTESLIKWIVRFLTDSNQTISGLVLQNWILDNNNVSPLFVAIRDRANTSLSSIGIFGIAVREGASCVVESLTNLIAATSNTLRVIRYRGNILLRSEDNSVVVESLGQHTLLHTLDFGHNNISIRMAELLRGVVERNSGLLQIYLPWCIFDEGGILTFLRSCASPAETALDFEGVTTEVYGFESIAPTAVAARSSLIMMQQRNVELRRLIAILLESYPSFSGEVDRGRLVRAIFYDSEEEILRALNSPVGMLYDMDYSLVVLIREGQVNLRNLLGQPDAMPLIDTIFPVPSAARIKKMKSKEHLKVSSVSCAPAASSNSSQEAASGSIDLVLPVAPGMTAAASRFVAEWFLSWIYWKSYPKK